MTTIYLIRHGKAMRADTSFSNDTFQVKNEKIILSIEGEKEAEERFSKEPFTNIDLLYSSSFVRAISTAKYIASNNNIDIKVMDELGERKFGVNDYSEIPPRFEIQQLYDLDLKINNGESQREVSERMHFAINKILNENKNKRIAIVSHGTAITFFLKRWCSIDIVDDKLLYTYKDKVLLHGSFANLLCFKLDFDDNNELIDISMV